MSDVTKLNGENNLKENALEETQAHFNIMDKATRITKPTLAIPTLQVRLRETFAKLMADGLINTNPVKIQKASKGKIELWAHLPTEWNH